MKTLFTENGYTIKQNINTGIYYVSRLGLFVAKTATLAAAREIAKADPWEVSA